MKWSQTDNKNASERVQLKGELTSSYSRYYNNFRNILKHQPCVYHLLFLRLKHYPIHFHCFKQPIQVVSAPVTTGIKECRNHKI